jgi:hypothetical protein
MTKTELIKRVRQTDSHYFDKKTMAFFGDTLRNYRIDTNIHNINSVRCYKLNRLSPVNGGLVSPVFFSIDTFEQVDP